MDPAAFRAQFPVLDEVAYLNAGTDGPLPRASIELATNELAEAGRLGRVTAHFQRRQELGRELRAAYARLMRAPVEEIALTTSTTDGLARVIAGMPLGPGDEIVTSDQEHPGLIGPLIAARMRGATITAVPFAETAAAVGPRTKLVAMSHVSWVGGEVAPAELADVGVPVILDGAQGAGAVGFDPRELGAVAYCAAGQKWLCGADGTGLLWIDPAFSAQVGLVSASYGCLADPSAGFESGFKTEAARFDTPSLPRESLAVSLAAIRVLEAAGLDAVQSRAVSLAATFASALAEAGHEVAPRGASTLVSWADADDEATRDRLAAAGIAVRNLPGRGLLRASVGAWNDERDLERLLAAL
jgi:L-cysteine/cystine lyase